MKYTPYPEDLGRDTTWDCLERTRKKFKDMEKVKSVWGKLRVFAGMDGYISKPVTADAVNAAIKEAAAGPMKGILAYTEDPIVLSDIIGDPHSSIFAPDWTKVVGDTMLKILTWYDNEWGYSCRSVDLIEKIAKM